MTRALLRLAPTATLFRAAEMVDLWTLLVIYTDKNTYEFLSKAAVNKDLTRLAPVSGDVLTSFEAVHIYRTNKRLW